MTEIPQELLRQLTVASADVSDIAELIKNLRTDLNEAQKTISRLRNELNKMMQLNNKQ